MSERHLKVTLPFVADVFCNSCFGLFRACFHEGADNYYAAVRCMVCGRKDAEILRSRWATQEEVENAKQHTEES